MSRKEEYEAKTEALLQPMVDERGLELVDVEYVKEGSNWYLRAFIDKPGGISIDDIEPISRELSEKLDQEDFISDAYILEVSSPGLGRPLKKDKDFVRSIGEEIEIHLYRAINKQKEFVGILKEFNKEENTFTVELEDGEETVFNRADVALVRLTFDF